MYCLIVLHSSPVYDEWRLISSASSISGVKTETNRLNVETNWLAPLMEIAVDTILSFIILQATLYLVVC
jgi:hypothetical protein